MEQAIIRVSVVDQAIERLRDSIERGTWAVGDRLPSESELTRQLGISRAPLREAVRALVHVGLLATRQGAGTYVVAVDETTVALDRRMGASDIVHVLEVRRGLDVEAARLAGRRRTDADLRSLADATLARRHAAEAGNQSAFAEADVSFHLAVASAAHNDLLLQLYESISLAVRRSVDSPISLAHVLDEDPDDHQVLFDAIRDRDETSAFATAAAILDLHLRDLTDGG